MAQRGIPAREQHGRFFHQLFPQAEPYLGHQSAEVDEVLDRPAIGNQRNRLTAHRVPNQNDVIIAPLERIADDVRVVAEVRGRVIAGQVHRDDVVATRA
jgi:hypothetical protein